MNQPTNALSTSRPAALTATLVLAAALVFSASSFAATGGPNLTVVSEAAPTQFHAGGSGYFYEIAVINDGGAESHGPVTLTDVLPRGLTVSSTTAACEQSTNGGVTTLSCLLGAIGANGGSALLDIYVNVPGEAAGTLVNSITATDSTEVAQATNTTPVTSPATQVPFGATIEGDLSSFGGGADKQAGSYPLDFSTELIFNTGSVLPKPGAPECSGRPVPSCAALNAQVKDLEVSLPPGLVGNLTTIPHCSQQNFQERGYNDCPANTQVGSLSLVFYGFGTQPQTSPVFNIKPPPGQPAELGFTISTLAHIPVFFRVRSDDYGLTAVISDISQFDPVRIGFLQMWGFPAAPEHDGLRSSQLENCTFGCPYPGLAPRPLLRTPTSCSDEPLSMSVAGDSWQNYQAEGVKPLDSTTLAPMTGCSLLPFNPSIAVAPSTRQAGAPAGYAVNVHLPQAEEPKGLATSDIRNVEITLPQGTVLSPSGANGLSACSEAQFQRLAQTAGNCPAASYVGSVKITTPLLSQPLTGSLFVGEPECSPCSPAQAASGQLVSVYLEAAGPGVFVKLVGHTRIDQSTGQLTAIFTNNPQVPVSDIEVLTEHGPSAPLANPQTCGAATATAALTSWSSSTPDQQFASFAVEGCNPSGFSPDFQAGRTSSTSAGAFTGFDVSLTRQDGEQTLGRVDVTMPPGLLGVLKSVPQCAEAQADAGTCPAASQIGSGSITAGPGAQPLTINGTRVYLTGPYAGQPFGLSIVTPAQAGPFVLAGNTGQGVEVVRAAIHVDPSTAQVTITSGQLPEALDGIPIQIRKIDIKVTRPAFLFNPTSCDPMSVAGSITSTTGAVDHVSSPFQATDCAILPFKPTFVVSTQGKASKANGASLHVRVTSGAGQANIAKVKVNLPLQLPSRLSTLQKACVDSVFGANPGSCPVASVVGQATAVTPLLAHPLTGPAYLVSHAGAAFPDLEIVLQGEGITLILDGNTQIKKGITSSIFRAVPDAPISSFDLVLPEGPHSVLATNLPAKAKHNLCGQMLNMPTVITGQNGAVVRQTTRVAVTGCPKHKTKGEGKKH
jgi:uncharacterized repeat protein (TIGR01451 family)